MNGYIIVRTPGSKGNPFLRRQNGIVWVGISQQAAEKLAGDQEEKDEYLCDSQLIILTRHASRCGKPSEKISFHSGANVFYPKMVNFRLYAFVNLFIVIQMLTYKMIQPMCPH